MYNVTLLHMNHFYITVRWNMLALCGFLHISYANFFFFWGAPFVVQSFDKQGFHAGTPPPFSLPSALGGTGPLNPGAAQGYAPAPFLHILPAHQQPHSQMLHHHLQQDGQVRLPSHTGPVRVW